nr:MAG TPA: hypothetical protein [Caudoviricetes sp.]
MGVYYFFYNTYNLSISQELFFHGGKIYVL